MSNDLFYDLFLDELRDIYDGEKQLVRVLPKFAENASSEELIEAFTNHWNETKNQVKRLEEVFKIINETPESNACEALKGILEEADEMIKKYPKSFVRDAALISAAQRVEHYEIAVYGTIRTFAKHLDLSNVASLLQESLNEEGNANKKLTEIAEGGFFTTGVNKRAEKGGSYGK